MSLLDSSASSHLPPPKDSENSPYEDNGLPSSGARRSSPWVCTSSSATRGPRAGPSWGEHTWDGCLSLISALRAFVPMHRAPPTSVISPPLHSLPFSPALDSLYPLAFVFSLGANHQSLPFVSPKALKQWPRQGSSQDPPGAASQKGSSSIQPELLRSLSSSRQVTEQTCPHGLFSILESFYSGRAGVL